MEFKLDLGIFNSVFAVPNSIVDEYIKLATADNLKVLLYCLRHAGKSLSAGEISRAVSVAEENVASSFDFWKQRGLFDSVERAALGEPVPVSKSPPIIERDYEFSPSEISDIIKDSNDVKYLFKCAESLHGRPLKPTEQKALAVIIEEYRMKPEIALMLMEYCFSIGKSSPSYIKKAAAAWLEQGIDSIESAEAHIKHLKCYHSEENELIRLFEVKDIPEARKPLFKKWLYEFNFSKEIIFDAYQITLEKTGKLEYTYMDRILTSWNKDGVGAKKISVVFKSNTEKPSYDLEEFYKLQREKYN
jgi:DnaD/phage-associated family protein